jgi:hypothetical protein
MSRKFHDPLSVDARRKIKRKTYKLFGRGDHLQKRPTGLNLEFQRKILQRLEWVWKF